MHVKSLVILACALSVVGCAAQVQSTSAGKQAAGSPSSASNPRVRVTTSMGSFVIELYEDRAPTTVAAFLTYVHEGQYSHTLFHRVFANFIIQGGAYDATYPYKMKAIPVAALPADAGVANESGNGLQNGRGMVGFARATSSPDQFYIDLADNHTQLDSRPDHRAYPVFGRVIQGMDVVDRIGATPTGGSEAEHTRATGHFNNCQDDAGHLVTCTWPLKSIVIETIEVLAD
jgi:peptidyl-prolyl cis-trans isomerase A (cyclophilin A)